MAVSVENVVVWIFLTRFAFGTVQCQATGGKFQCSLLDERENMAYTIRLLEQSSGGWLVEVWSKQSKIYSGTAPSQTKESARGEGKMFLYHKDSAAQFKVVEKRCHALSA